METAIKKAIEGGWKKHFYFSHFNNNEVALGDIRKDSENNPCFYIDKHQILLDSLFWQALGKAEGWSEKKICTITISDNKNSTAESSPLDQWELEWHSFIRHLAKGKSIDSFFETLLTNKE